MASYNVAPYGQGKWRARYRDDAGKQHTKVFRLKRDAEDWGKSNVAKLERKEWTDPTLGKVRFKEYAAEWLACKAKIKHSTRVTYASLLKEHILPVFGDRPLSTITFEDVNKWVIGLGDKGLSASRTRQAHIVLSGVLAMAVKARRIPVNPALGVELPSLPGKSERPERMLTEAQLWRLADEAGDQGLSVLVLGWCGLRFGEMAGLQRVLHEL